MILSAGTSWKRLASSYKKQSGKWVNESRVNNFGWLMCQSWGQKSSPTGRSWTIFITNTIWLHRERVVWLKKLTSELKLGGQGSISRISLWIHKMRRPRCQNWHQYFFFYLFWIRKYGYFLLCNIRKKIIKCSSQNFIVHGLNLNLFSSRLSLTSDIGRFALYTP